MGQIAYESSRSPKRNRVVKKHEHARCKSLGISRKEIQSPYHKKRGSNG